MGTIATTVTITVDLQHPEINTIHAKQFDALSRYADIKLLSGGKPWAAESSITYVIQYAKPDGTKGMYDKLPDGTTDAVTAETDASGCTVLRARFAPQMLTVAGRVRFSIAMMKTDGTKLQTFSAILDVEPSEVNSYTSKDYYKITSLDELLEKIKKCVKSVNNILPGVNGDVTLHAESIHTQVDALNYQGSVEGALEALATMHAALPVARGSSADGDAYTAAGDDLPTVQTGSYDTQTDPVGKGRQIVFVPMKKNQSTMPTLQINGGEVIPIQMRAPRNQGDNDDAPDATQPIWIGALMRGVPYTMTFCGKYWLIDSRISQFDQYNEDILNRYASALMGLYDGDTVAVPIINSMDEGVDDGISTMYIRRSTEENDTPDQSGNVTVPTEKRVAELIRKDSRLPKANGDSGDGIAYSACGDDLPTVKAGSVSARVGKGRQIVFIPSSKNKSDAPTLQLNGGEAIPIRMRAPKNQGSDDSAPDATLPVPVGALMSGVPYTLTFCGLYWLIDSQICGINQILKVNITKNADGTYTSDKTFSDLKTAHDGGRILICSFEDITMRWDSAYLLHLSWATALGFGFSGVLEPEHGYKIMAEVWINSSNNIGFTATDINDFPRPTALDIGKVMAVSENGNAEWTAVTNAEEVAV